MVYCFSDGTKKTHHPTHYLHVELEIRMTHLFEKDVLKTLKTNDEKFTKNKTWNLAFIEIQSITTGKNKNLSITVFANIPGLARRCMS